MCLGTIRKGALAPFFIGGGYPSLAAGSSISIMRKSFSQVESLQVASKIGT